MRRGLALALFLSALSWGRAFADPPPAPAKPPSELERLEQVLTRAQDARSQGQLKPERYDDFLVQFRESLDQAWSLSPRTPADSAAYARIQARLGDSAQAVATLDAALQQDPQDPDLRLTLGEVSFEKKDFAAALAEANAVLARDPGNKRAVALKHFSEGRSSGVTTEGPSSLQLGAEGPSVLEHPEVVAAGRRATAHMNALHFLDKAITRLKLKDSHEALRYATLAEASDPSIPDAPMQQGLAYMGLQQPGKAHGRFAQAEEMWQAKGDEQAALARTMKERAAAQMAAQSKQEEDQRPAPAPDSRRTTWPLGGAAAGLLLAGMGASLLKRDEETEERWRKPLLVASIVGIGVLGGGLLGYAAYAMAAPALTAGGGTLALAGGGTMSAAAAGEAAVVATVAGGLAGGAAGAKAAENAGTEPAKRETPPNGAPGQGPGPLPVPLPIPPGFQTKSADCSLKVDGDVLARFIDGTRLAPGFLPKHEGPGHTMEKHVGKKPEYLRERLRGEGLEDASMFFDQSTAERVIRLAVEAHEGEIAAWFTAGGLAPLSVRHTGSHLNPIGNALSWQNPDMLLPKYDAQVRLKRTPQCEIFILTAFPD